VLASRKMMWSAQQRLVRSQLQLSQHYLTGRIMKGNGQSE
jgi:hypothetical protein